MMNEYHIYDPINVSPSKFVDIIQRFYKNRLCPSTTDTGLLSEPESGLFEKNLQALFQVPSSTVLQAVALRPDLSTQFLLGITETMQRFHLSWTDSIIRKSDNNSIPIFAHRVMFTAACENVEIVSGVGYVVDKKAVENGELFLSDCSDFVLCVQADRNVLMDVCSISGNSSTAQLASLINVLVTASEKTVVSHIPMQILAGGSITEIVAAANWTVGLLSTFNSSGLVSSTDDPALKIIVPSALVPRAPTKSDQDPEVDRYAYRCIMLPQGHNEWGDHHCEADIFSSGILQCRCRHLFGIVTVIQAHVLYPTNRPTSIWVTTATTDAASSTNDAISPGSTWTTTPTVDLTFSTNDTYSPSLTTGDFETSLNDPDSPITTLSSYATTSTGIVLCTFAFSDATSGPPFNADPSAMLECYANSTHFSQSPARWSVEALNATLEALIILARNPPVSFSAITNAVQVTHLYVHQNKTNAVDSSDDWWIFIDAIDLIVTICDTLLGLDLNGEIVQPESVEIGNGVAALMLDTLEELHTISLPYNGAHIILKDYISVSINAFEVNSSSQFDFFSTKLKTVVTVEDVMANQTMSAHFSRSVEEGAFSGVSRLELSEDAVQYEFNHFVQSLPPDATGIFSLSLMAVHNFRFGKFAHPSGMPKRNARRSGTVLVSASMKTTRPHDDMVTVTHKVDNLFKGRFRGRKEYHCVFLDLSSNEQMLTAWSTAGCHLESKNVSWSEGATVECVCNHLTPFTMLLDLCGSILNSDEAENTALSRSLEPTIVTMSSLSVSIICCFVILCHLVWALWQKIIGLTPRNFTRLNLVISIFLAHTLFLFTYVALEAEDEIWCLIMAVACHWLMLVIFAWMAVEAYRMFMPTLGSKFYTATTESKRVPGDTYGGFRWKSWTIAWVLPLSLPFTASLSHIEKMQYRFAGHAYDVEERWCWLDPQHVIFVAVTFLGPVTIISACNIFFFVLYLRQRIKSQRKMAQIPQLTVPQRLSIINLIGTSGLLGGTWLLGYFLLFACSLEDDVKIALGCVYIVLSATQGVFILTVHIRGAVHGSFRKKKRVRINGQVSEKTSTSTVSIQNAAKLGAFSVDDPTPSVNSGVSATPNGKADLPKKTVFRLYLSQRSDKDFTGENTKL